jgi:hypothetical protein
MTYFFKETKTNIVINSLFITDSYRICQKLRDLKAFQVTFKICLASGVHIHKALATLRGNFCQAASEQRV